MPLTRDRRPDPQSVTTAPRSRSEDQSHRLHQYLATMSVRTVCFVLAIVFDGWLRWVFAAAAILLPFFAVVAANAVAPRVRGRVRPVTPMPDDVPRIADRAAGDEPQTWPGTAWESTARDGSVDASATHEDERRADER